MISYFCELIEIGRNTGPSFARNLASKEAKYDWIMSLDNDVYFISNILPIAQKEIAVVKYALYVLTFIKS